MTIQPDIPRKPETDRQDQPFDFSSLDGKSSNGGTKESGGASPAVEGYVVLEHIGSGGMGTVWKAIHLATQREVALKVMAIHLLGSAEARRRFEREIEIAARFDHPGIVRVIDAGVRADHCFYAMELVDGEPLDAYVQDRNLSDQQIIALFKLICEAIAHAHERGVIHRDLKFSNVLVTADGTPRVLDFGLARDFEDGDVNKITLSLGANTMGTLAFMAPEQAAGRTKDVSTRTDVFALGSMLYRLLTRNSPHDLGASRHVVLRRIAEAEIRPPRSVRRDLDKDLDALLRTALAHQPEQRYASAREFADELERYRQGAPLKARAVTFRYTAGKWMRRHRGPIALASLILSVLLTISVVAYINIVEARDGSQVLLAESLLAQGDFLFSNNQHRQAKVKYREAKRILTTQTQSTKQVDLALWDSYRRSPPPLLTFRVGPKPPTCMAALPDGRHVLFGCDDTIRLFDVALGMEKAQFSHHRAAVEKITISPDGRTVLSTDADGVLLFWKLDKREKPNRLDVNSNTIRGMAFTSNGQDFFVAAGKNVQKWSVAGLNRIADVPMVDPGSSHLVESLYVLPGDQSVLIRTTAGEIALWDTTADNPTKLFNAGLRMILPLADRKTFLGVSRREPSSFRQWKIEKATETARMSRTHHAPLSHLHISHDHQRIVTADQEGDVKVWSMFDFREVQSFTALQTAPTFIEFLPRHRVVLAGDQEGVIRLWLVEEIDHYQSLHTPQSSAVSFDAKGRFALVLQNETLPPVIWDVKLGCVVKELPFSSLNVSSVAISPDDRAAALGLRNGRVEVIEVATGNKLLSELLHPNAVTDVSFSDDGQLLVSVATQGNGPLILETNTWKTHSSILSSHPIAAVFSRSAEHVAVTTQDSGIQITKLQANEKPIVLHSEKHGATCVAFSPDGERLLSGGADQKLNLWDAKTGELILELTGHQWPVTQVAISPDGRFAASGDSNGIVILWDLQTHTPLREFVHFGSIVQAIKLKNDAEGVTLASLGRISHWDFSRIIDHSNQHPGKAIITAIGTTASQTAVREEEFARYYQNQGVWRWAAELWLASSKRSKSVPSELLLQAALRTNDDTVIANARDVIPTTQTVSPRDEK